jgi:hypothetical protein
MLEAGTAARIGIRLPARRLAASLIECASEVDELGIVKVCSDAKQ